MPKLKQLKEDEEQAVVVQWFDMAYPVFSGRLVASQNGIALGGNAVSRSKRINKAKKTGLRKGYPDLHLPVASGGFHGLFIEMKRKQGGRVSEEQQEWIDWLNGQGYAANACKGADEAMEAIKAYINARMCGSCWLEHGSPECQGDHYRDALGD